MPTGTPFLLFTLGEAAPKLNQALAAAGVPPRGAKIVMKGQIPPLQQTISGLRIGLLLAVVVIFLLRCANSQSIRLGPRYRTNRSGGPLLDQKPAPWQWNWM